MSRSHRTDSKQPRLFQADDYISNSQQYYRHLPALTRIVNIIESVSVSSVAILLYTCPRCSRSFDCDCQPTVSSASFPHSLLLPHVAELCEPSEIPVLIHHSAELCGRSTRHDNASSKTRIRQRRVEGWYLQYVLICLSKFRTRGHGINRANGWQMV